MSYNEYIWFEDESHLNPQRKTRTVVVYSRRSGDPLGEIKWYGSWRQYAFFPHPSTIFNPDCLDSINDEIRGMMLERKLKVGVS